MSEDDCEGPVIGKAWMNLVLILISVFIILKSCSNINESLGVKNDNIIEQIGERFVERKLGLAPNSLDFTPDTQDGPVAPENPE